ncbi:MAG: GNAT family N-acetyltransferase [Succinivibrionaceae bacterium]|nr:GNAT family N-acetyltransferase [Succinivibrionaceae bacterium]MDY6376878.1 GNAT family N-acetyltransferase [Succinivibrionaceae bacterium]
MQDIKVEIASPDDAEQLLQIYAPYVTGTAITFEYTVPSEDEFRERIVHTLKTYPYLKAVRGGEILGYAYTGTFKGRAAYDRAAETSIYVRQGLTRSGVGKLRKGEFPEQRD